MPLLASVTVRYGGFWRRAACAVGTRAEALSVLAGSAEGPACLRYCEACEDSRDQRWVWIWSDHDGSVSVVHYRAAGSGA